MSFATAFALGNRYYYQVGDGRNFSSTYEFRSLLSPGPYLALEWKIAPFPADVLPLLNQLPLSVLPKVLGSRWFSLVHVRLFLRAAFS